MLFDRPENEVVTRIGDLAREAKNSTAISVLLHQIIGTLVFSEIQRFHLLCPVTTLRYMPLPIHLEMPLTP